MRAKSSPKPKPLSAKRESADSGTLVRISKRDKDILQELSRREGEPMPKVLHKALEVYRRQKFLDEVNNSYARLKNNPEAWKTEHDERDLWETAFSDSGV